MRNIGIVFGGVSFEHEISIVSAIALKDILQDKINYIFLDSNRQFYLIDIAQITSKLFQSGAYKKQTKLTLANGGFYKKSLMGSTKVEIDYVINLVHGGDGEDGKIAGLFEFYGIDYIGPRIEASAISSSKYLTKAYAKEIGVKVLDYQLLNINDKRVIDLEYPIIIKPLRLGSSIGVSVVKSSSEVDYALDVAFEFDGDVLIEKYIDGISEYNLAGAMGDNEYIFSIIEELSKDGMLTFDKKYMDFSRSQRAISADISQNLTTKLYDSFKKIYNTLFDGALIRCDFFVYEDEVYLNEINPIPGSMANYLFSDFDKVIQELSHNLPKQQKISVEYNYINSIASAKGKA
jgi:D-alanine-D-alanine ligase